MKKLISAALLAVIAFSLIVGCSSAAPTIESIKIKTQPSKTSYTVGDKLDLSGIVVVVTYTNGRTTEIPAGKFKTAPLNGSALSTEGTTDVTVFYTEGKVTKSVVFTIAVKGNATNGHPDYVTFTGDAPFTVSVENPGWLIAPNNGVIQYSADGTRWEPDLYSTPEGWDGSPVESGFANKLFFRGMGNRVITGGTGRKWTISGSASSVSLSGNIMTLLDYDNPDTAKMGIRCFKDMFETCGVLSSVSPGFLSATSLATECYSGMFAYTVLNTAPDLPAKSLAEACYLDMFYGCFFLTKPPIISATSLAPNCCNSMFFECVSLNVSESGGTPFFTCPKSIPNCSVSEMFSFTSGTFSNIPEGGVTYYYY